MKYCIYEELNHKISNSVLASAIPEEFFENKWTEEDIKSLKKNLKDRFKKRIEENSSIVPCLSCPLSK